MASVARFTAECMPGGDVTILRMGAQGSSRQAGHENHRAYSASHHCALEKLLPMARLPLGHGMGAAPGRGAVGIIGRRVLPCDAVSNRWMGFLVSSSILCSAAEEAN